MSESAGRSGLGRGAVVAEQPPRPRREAFWAVARSVAKTAALLARHRIRQPTARVGHLLSFADGTAGRVYRETFVEPPPTEDPAVLVVEFRLRWVRGFAHAVFRAESLLNTPLFAGFDGFVSKLWLAHDEAGRYRGFYEWDGPELAASYARALWRVLALVSVRGSIHYVVLPGRRRDDLLRDPGVLDDRRPVALQDWWRLTKVESTTE